MTLGFRCPISRLRAAVPAGGGTSLPLTAYGEPELQHPGSCSWCPAEPQCWQLDGEAGRAGLDRGRPRYPHGSASRPGLHLASGYTAYPQGQEALSTAAASMLGAALLV